MCRKLKSLKNKSAYSILVESGQLESIPVNISRILKELGVNEREADFTKLEELPIFAKYGEILGAAYAMDDDLSICYRKFNPEEFTDQTLTYEEMKKKFLHRSRFTLAHELAHCCLHMDPNKERIHLEFRIKEFQETEREMAANIFAGELLIPYDSLIDVYQRLSVPSLDVLADIFDVSRSVMKERLAHLKLPI